MADQYVSSENPNASVMPERIWADRIARQMRVCDPCHGTEYVRADLVAESPGPWPVEAEFELWQNGEFAAGAGGPREDALREILGYAATYGQDGPVTIYEVKRFPVTLPA